MKSRVSAVLFLAFGFFGFVAPGIAFAECNPLDFLVKDYKATVVDERTSIAFLKIATKEQYDAATQNIGGSGSYGLISGAGHWDESKQSASKESDLTRFNYDHSYYLNYLSQRLSPAAAAMYTACLEQDKNAIGLRIWLAKRQGEFFTLNTFWVGGDNEGPATLDSEPILDSLVIVQKPASWPRGKTQQLVVKKAANVDGFIGLSVGKQTQSFVALRDPVTVPILTHVVASDKLMNAHTTRVSGTVCPAGQDSDCVSPRSPGGSLQVGSASVTDLTSAQAGRAVWAVTTNTPEQICVSFTVSTGACEAGNSGTARLTAVERYPGPEPAPAR
jgi:hypothetical protein